MSGIYPKTPPVVNAPADRVHEFLRQPAQVHRRMVELADLRFLADFLFPRRVKSDAGAILYQIAEKIFLDGDPSAVNPGAEYPRLTDSPGEWASAMTTKQGVETPITDEYIGRYGRTELDRKMTRTRNSIVRKVDSLCMAGVGALVTRTHGAIAAWHLDAAHALRDVALAVAKVENRPDELTFDASTLLLDYELYALMTSDEKILAGLAREDSTSVTASGEIRTIGGRTIVPTNRLPQGRHALLVDRDELGALGYEEIPSPDWTGNPSTEPETRIRRDPDGNDSWLLGARRPVVPIIWEPSAGIWITGAKA